MKTSEVLLDIPETELETITDRLIDRMIVDDSSETVTKDELKSLIFADDGKTRLTETLQATVTKDGGASWGWEQTWICCPITVPTLNKRHVGIARLKSNVNLGVQMEEVRLFILILCPSDVKITKTALETARTFGTVFTGKNLSR